MGNPYQSLRGSVFCDRPCDWSLGALFMKWQPSNLSAKNSEGHGLVSKILHWLHLCRLEPLSLSIVECFLSKGVDNGSFIDWCLVRSMRISRFLPTWPLGFSFPKWLCSRARRTSKWRESIISYRRGNRRHSRYSFRLPFFWSRMQRCSADIGPFWEIWLPPIHRRPLRWSLSLITNETSGSGNSEREVNWRTPWVSTRMSFIPLLFAKKWTNCDFSNPTYLWRSS